jgi:hypothetical protein
MSSTSPPICWAFTTSMGPSSPHDRSGVGGRSRMPAVKDVGEPGAREPHARFDGGGRNLAPLVSDPKALAPPAYPTATRVESRRAKWTTTGALGQSCRSVPSDNSASSVSSISCVRYRNARNPARKRKAHRKLGRPVLASRTLAWRGWRRPSARRGRRGRPRRRGRGRRRRGPTTRPGPRLPPPVTVPPSFARMSMPGVSPQRRLAVAHGSSHDLLAWPSNDTSPTARLKPPSTM